MPAIVRVKRRIDEEPLNAFILNGKKRRLNEESDEGAVGGQDDAKDEISTVLKFAGTIKEPDNTATTQFAQRLSKNEAKDLVQTKSARKAGNFTERARQEMRQTAQENRFRVVNCMRTTLPQENTNESGDGSTSNTVDNKVEDTKSLTIVDIEKNANETDATTNLQQIESSQTAIQSPADSDTGYVYDLYLPDDDVQARNSDLLDDNYLSVYGMQDIIFEDAYNDDEDYDTEDSNREDYFTNDYPDEDDELQSANENDDDDDEDDGVGSMRRAIEKFVFDEDDDSYKSNSDQDYYDGFSSDEEAYGFQDPYIHNVDPDIENVAPDVDTVDVNDFETAYERYKKNARGLRSQHQSNVLRVHETMIDEAEFYTFEETGKQNRSSDSENYHSADEQD